MLLDESLTTAQVSQRLGRAVGAVYAARRRYGKTVPADKHGTMFAWRFHGCKCEPCLDFGRQRYAQTADPRVSAGRVRRLKDRHRELTEPPYPVERVFAAFADHERLAVLYAPARLKSVSAGSDGTLTGVGSARTMGVLGLHPVVERTIELIPNQLLAYSADRSLIVRLGVKYHRGEFRFSPTADGNTNVRYAIDITPRLPIPQCALKSVLERGLTRILPRIEKVM